MGKKNYNNNDLNIILSGKRKRNGVIVQGLINHDIQHLSASSINTWINSQTAFVSKYLFKKDFAVGFSALRGNAVERSISHYLKNLKNNNVFDESLEIGIEYFRNNVFLSSDELENEEIIIRKMLEQCEISFFDFFKKINFDPNKNDQMKHQSFQEKYLKLKNNQKVLIKGFSDFFICEGEKIVIDLKTTLRCPSVMSQSHKIQASIYKWLFDANVFFIYVTNKKNIVINLTQSDYFEHMELVKNTSENINNFLSLTKNKNLLFASSVHDPSNFFWKENLDIYNQINLTIERE